jgi:hypothetical protein
MGYHCIVECDHRNISFLKKSSMSQLARWRLILQEHDFSIRFLQGSLNLVSDGLSRQHVDVVEASLHDVVPEMIYIYIYIYISSTKIGAMTNAVLSAKGCPLVRQCYGCRPVTVHHYFNWYMTCDMYASTFQLSLWGV